MHSDVLIVGYGPVGQLLSILMADKGWKTTVVERWPEPYPMPRAVAFDSEVGRILQSVGVADALREHVEPSGTYSWRNANGEVLLEIDASEQGWCGWPDSTSMYQPGLEAALIARGAELRNLRVLRGYEAVELHDRGDLVDVVIDGRDGDRRDLSATWVVGCDGANSFVQRHIGSEFTSLGFSRDWLICDVVPHDQQVFHPNNLQVCDPARPRTAVSAGPGHRRWEFMRLPGEDLAELNTPETVWRMLELFDITPQNATLERHAVYTFEAGWAVRWRSGHILIAGDAAHLMPPFAAQGMCSGFRDAANLAWKLDLVLANTAGEGLLDTYETERRKHVQHAVEMSVNLGKIICQDDPDKAADRDTVMLESRKRGLGQAQPQAAVVPLRQGFLDPRAKAGSGGLTGDLIPQPRMSSADKGAALFDTVVGHGFVLMATESPWSLLDEDNLAFLKGLGTQLVHVVAPGSGFEEGAVVDIDGVCLSYLAGAGMIAALVRPDCYVFGSASDAKDLNALVEELRRGLAAP